MTAEQARALLELLADLYRLAAKPETSNGQAVPEPAEMREGGR